MIKENKKPVLIVIAGPNGSGKTTITSKILHHEWMEDSVYINPDIVAQRVMEGGHDVPITKVISRYQKSISNCKYLVNKVNRVYLYDNSIDRADASLLIRLSDGEIVKKYVEALPEWAKKIVE